MMRSVTSGDFSHFTIGTVWTMIFGNVTTSNWQCRDTVLYLYSRELGTTRCHASLMH